MTRLLGRQEKGAREEAKERKGGEGSWATEEGGGRWRVEGGGDGVEGGKGREISTNAPSGVGLRLGSGKCINRRN